MAQSEPAQLTDDQYEALVRAMRVWAERHPDPTTPAFGFVLSTPVPAGRGGSSSEGGGETGGVSGYRRGVSPAELAEAVARRSPEAEVFVRMVRIGLEAAPFERIIVQLTGDDNERR